MCHLTYCSSSLKGTWTRTSPHLSLQTRPACNQQHNHTAAGATGTILPPPGKNTLGKDLSPLPRWRPVCFMQTHSHSCADLAEMFPSLPVQKGTVPSFVSPSALYKPSCWMQSRPRSLEVRKAREEMLSAKWFPSCGKQPGWVKHSLLDYSMLLAGKNNLFTHWCLLVLANNFHCKFIYDRDLRAPGGVLYAGIRSRSVSSISSACFSTWFPELLPCSGAQSRGLPCTCSSAQCLPLVLTCLM